jgi:dihydropteroate synthase
VNDISGLHFDAHMAATIACHHASAVIMHIRGTPKTMQEDPVYEDVVQEVSETLRAGIAAAESAGIQQLLIDPGIGFGKTRDHNLEILRRLNEFQHLGYPVLVGPSRKSFIGKVLDLPVDERLEGTAAAVAVSILNGANVVRVHDVRAMTRVARMADAILGARGEAE